MRVQSFPQNPKYSTMSLHQLGCVGICLLLAAYFSAAVAENLLPPALKAVQDVTLEPTFERNAVGTAAIWQIPPSPVAVLFIAHGHNHLPTVFWDKNAGCAFCKSLPEERLITKAAVARGYAVITIEADQRYAGWALSTNLETNQDFVKVKAFLNTWRQQHGLQNLPLTGYGLSRGGDFVTVMSLGLKVHGIATMVCRGVKAALEAASKDSYPSVLSMSMPKDEATQTIVEQNVALLQSKGIRAQELQIFPFPISESYFSERILGLGRNASASIFRAMKNKGYLSTDNYVNQPYPVDWAVYTNWDWSEMVKSLQVLPDAENGELRWMDDVVEEISLSFGFHCCSSLIVREMMDWLDCSWNNVAVHTEKLSTE